MPPTLRPVLSPARRRRRRIVWTTATAIVAGVWVWSSQWMLFWSFGPVYIDVKSGAFGCAWSQIWADPPHNEAGFAWLTNISGYTTRLRWTFWKRNLSGGIAVGPRIQGLCIVPLWLAVIPLLIPTTRAWLSQPLSPSACPRCGYDLAGLAADKACPECGSSRAAAPAQT